MSPIDFAQGKPSDRRILTPHFALDEFLRSDAALRLGINNDHPPLEVLRNLGYLAETLERVRTALGHPLIISSGWRCPALNRAIGGADGSAHVLGLAVDFICPEFGTPLEVARAIARSGISFDQLIHEGRWVHLAISRAHNRGELLTAHFDQGRASYSAGLVISRNFFRPETA